MLRADGHATGLVIGPMSARLKGYVPWTAYALRPFALAIVLNDLLVNRRRAYLEFGAGISTVYVAKLAEMQDLPLEIVSLEHDAAWIDAMRGALRREGLESRVRFVHAPWVDRDDPAPVGRIRWYDEAAVVAGLRGSRFGAILVDGPPGEARMNRHPAVPVLLANGLLEDGCALLLDDVHRRPEAAIARSWAAQLGRAHRIVEHRIAWFGTAGGLQPFLDRWP